MTGQTNNTRVAVLGCGAIGSLYAAHLARVPSVEVLVVDPWQEHTAAIAQTGLRVSGHANFTASVQVAAEASQLPQCDFALVTTKSEHTLAAVEAARHALQKAAVASLQNGLGNEEEIATVLPQVIRGTIVTAGHVTAPGHVSYDAPGDTWLGPFEPSAATADQVTTLADLLTRSGMNTVGLSDARGPQWTKVIFNAATSPLAALTGLSIGQVCTHPDLRSQVARLVDEALVICEAAGIELTRAPAEAIEEAISEAYGHLPSMLQDVRSRRHTEIDVLNGGIVAEGRRLGIEAPGHLAMVALLHGLEQSWATIR